MAERRNITCMSLEEVRQHIKDAVQRAGGQRALARRLGVSAAHVNNMVHGRSEPNEAVALQIGLVKTVQHITTYTRTVGGGA